MILREIFLPKVISDGEPPKKWWGKAATAEAVQPVQELAVEVEAENISDVQVHIVFRFQIILTVNSSNQITQEEAYYLVKPKTKRGINKNTVTQFAKDICERNLL